MRKSTLLAVAAFISLAPRVQAQMPPGWSGVNLGTSTGGETYDSATGTYAIAGSGSGSNIPGFDVDNVHFTYMQTSGDFEIAARLVTAPFINYSGTYKGQVGLMIRTGIGSTDNCATASWWAGSTHPGSTQPNNQNLLTQVRWTSPENISTQGRAEFVKFDNAFEGKIAVMEKRLKRKA